jgi:hypothetical protein
VWTRRWKKLYHWHPADVLHSRCGALELWYNTGVRRARGDKALGQYVTALRASERGQGSDRFRSLVVDDATLERGCAQGSLVVDVRLRDALRRMRAEPTEEATPPPDPGVVSESVAVRDADLVRLRRHVDHLAARVATLEARYASRGPR